ncbi:site-specific integrase [Crenobacter cavernae]|uniref:Site-specific integrase n=1 Tax=Crenobacter cavernae TaxID=2290923 RepID=A0A345Y240_9NEIS|nr:site-specific integrase [Crenobacter cavernae]AXK37992.1 site-specific integrase [Crenobacter cavernae]
MATINHRGPHQYQVTIRRKGFPTQTKTFETKREAQAWANTIESEMARGVFVDRSEAERTTLGEALQRYAREVTPRKKSAAKELSTLRKWLAHPLAARTLASLRSVDFATYRDARLKEVGANTVRLELALISHLFTTLRGEWSIPIDNPITSIRKPELPPGRDRRLVGDEEARLLAAASDSMTPSLLLAIQLAIETGMRAGEIVQLTWWQIDLAAKVIRLPKTKNGAARVVPLSKKAERLLRALPCSLGRGTRLMTFHDSNGLSAAFRRDCARAGIEGLCFHDLRHEAASRIAPKMEVATLAKVIGWKTLQMAMRYYNPTDAELVHAVRKTRAG